ncbi:hypothetical protein TCDM_13140 [Trypanosoma cruzi Dm28c]|uniref:Uncharacterized protein n=1 Tax=Trypanosoma cruzi Dm28c TaxID=1416333 RepID=V5AP26_TRYCR|nr:hypothetical protein TCDM_13140 [Trypanosoma cruzi Dm28c]
MDEESLLRVAFWEIACSVCVVCGQRAVAVFRWPWRCVASRPRWVTAGGVCVCCVDAVSQFTHTLRWCLCVREGLCGRWSSVLLLPDCLLSRSLRGCPVLSPTDVSDVLPLLPSFHFLHTHTHTHTQK